MTGWKDSLLKLFTMTTLKMEVALSAYFNYRANIIVPNISWGFGIHECDLFVLRPSGYTTEVEIKISKSDLMADFKKKHTHSDKRIQNMYYALPLDLYEVCKDLIPEHAGILTVSESSKVSCKRIAIKRKDAVPLSLKEQLAIARLGTLRVWKLKQKMLLNSQK